MKKFWLQSLIRLGALMAHLQWQHHNTMTARMLMTHAGIIAMNRRWDNDNRYQNGNVNLPWLALRSNPYHGCDSSRYHVSVASVAQTTLDALPTMVWSVNGDYVLVNERSNNRILRIIG